MNQKTKKSRQRWMCLLCGRKDLRKRNAPHFCGHKHRSTFKKASLRKGMFSCFVRLPDAPPDKAQHCDEANRTGGKTTPLKPQPPKGQGHGLSPTGTGETTLMTAGFVEPKNSSQTRTRPIRQAHSPRQGSARYASPVLQVQA